METIQWHWNLSFSTDLRKSNDFVKSTISLTKTRRKRDVVCLSMLAPRRFLWSKKKKKEVFKDKEDGLQQQNWRKLMSDIEESGSAVSVLRRRRICGEDLSRDVVLGTVLRFNQMKKWEIVCELLEWLRFQHWWNFSEMDFFMLMTAYGKQGQFNKAEILLKYMNENGYAPNVMCHTALMEAYGRAGQYNKAETVFRRMQLNGPEPSLLTYQLILKMFVQGDKYKEAETIFDALLDDKSPFKPDQKMFHMMIYMYRKLGDYDQARNMFGLMAARGVPQSTVTFNSLMSFETNYKEVSSIYDQMQRAGANPDVTSYSLLIRAYGKARREDEALAVFEEMLDAGVRPTRKAYNILLDAFAISGMVEEAKTVLKSMSRNRCYPDLCSYTTLLLAYVNASDMDGAEKIFRRLKLNNLSPNVVTYGALMKGYAKLNNMEKLMSIYEEMQMQGMKPNQTIFTILMDAYARNADFGSGVFWFKEMESSGCKADQKAKNILLSLAKTPEEQEEAKELVGHATLSKKKQLDGTLQLDEGEESDDEDEMEFSILKATHERSNAVLSSNGQS
ncbi:Pentatricopeptide repeat-containing protein [Nymphaea thermarum]|nr:Pentatricopeptide repeat-containing protein [Nymphaea thermarum]